MAVSDDRKYTKAFVYNLLEGVKGKTLGEVDKSHQFARTIEKPKITGIAGDVIEQSVFGYERDSEQECDIEIDGVLTELKTTGVRVPENKKKAAKGKIGAEYNIFLRAKEPISITGVTFKPDIQRDFMTSHFQNRSLPNLPYTIFIVQKKLFLADTEIVGSKIPKALQFGIKRPPMSRGKSMSDD